MKKDPKIYFAIDNCFASKRWTIPADWSKLIADLGIYYIEASADTECDPLYMGEEYTKAWRDSVKDACAKTGVNIINLYSGHGTYSTVGLTHWDSRARERIRDKWIKAQVDTAAAFGAGLGFFAHAMDESFLNDKAQYQAALEQLYADLADIAAHAAEMKLTSCGVEQMYSPHQPPWTLSGTKTLLKEVYARGNNPFYITDDVGHMNGQQFFLPPTKDYILDMIEQKKAGKAPKRIWLGSQKAYGYFTDALKDNLTAEDAAARILDDCAANPHLFCEKRDGDVYAWLEETACFSPIIHLQQSDGKSSPHWPFDPLHNEKGIIEGEKVLRAIAKSYEQEEEDGMPPYCDEIALTLEPFIGTAGNCYDAVEEIADSVEYWRKFIPKDGMRLSEILALLDK